jgi:predicted membrane GTPase involved in stress response
LYNGEVIDNRIFFEVEDQTDPTLLAYYRILQVMNDGATLISSIVSADCDDEKDFFVLYPNPSNGNMNLEYTNANEVKLQIYDVFGKLVFEQVLPEAKHTKTVQLRADNVPAGSYSYKVILDDEVKSGSIVIVK